MDQLESELGPYGLVPLWITIHPKATPRAVQVYALLAGKYVDVAAGRTCYPSRTRIATDLGVSDRTVDGAIQNLLDINAMTVTKRFAKSGDQTSNLYRLRVVEPKGGEESCATPREDSFATPREENFALTKPSSNQTQKTSAQPTSNCPTFMDFWDLYPKRKSKKAAARAWAKLTPAERIAAIAALPRATSSPDWRKEDGKFVPYPATWLNAGGWEDEHPPAHQDDGWAP